MTEKKIKLPPVLTRGDFETDEEYREYLDIENSSHIPISTTLEEREDLKEIAQLTIERIVGNKIPIGLRLPKRDVDRAKSLALQKGVPYQTLISSVLHQYLDGELVERDRKTVSK
ncbi:MAG: hypothetical protein GKR95_23280 [Gammaproteobacteria bacterium]|nr:hypothetical protein [Gammaproteobacteria bacterium]NKB64910.1 hypothetical protein [Gammaproteobacteria bacterium]